MNSDTITLSWYPFSAELIRTRLREVLLAENPGIDNIIEYLTANSGKMIRPRLVYMTASMSEHDPLVVRDIAVAIELIHLASLIHDDIIDHAMIRRGKPSINSMWGNHASILAGDYLFASAFNLINSHGMQAIMENVTATIRTMCSGEISQMSLAGDIDITEEKYLEKTYGKTACLFASSCKVGALASSMPGESVYALEQYGLCLGYAYQILDDLLDFMADSKTLGKPAGNDLLEGNITLPVIHALKNKEYGDRLRSLLKNQQFNEQKIALIIELLINSQSIDYSLCLSRRFIAAGIKHLDSLEPGPAVKELKYMAGYLLVNYYRQIRHNEKQIQDVVQI